MLIKRVVALDDDQEYLKLLKEFSDLLGVEFIGCSNSSQLDFTILQSSDLLLLDIYMPDDDGLDVLMKLSLFSFDGFVAIMSGAADNIIESMVSLTNDLGIVLLDNLKKPIKLKEFHALVKSDHVNTSLKYSEVTSVTPLKFSEVFSKGAIKPWFDKEYIYPVFQPQVSSVDQRVTGIECLTRFNHPDLGVLEPATFIELIESAGLIDFYTTQFIEHSLQKVAPLISKDVIKNCSFNISASSLNIHFVDDLVSLIQSYGVSAEKITIEITETSAISMTTEAKYAISRLKVFGVTLSIDDFGTGYSVIRHLVEMPFDELKIDRSFIAELETNKTSRIIVDVLMNLARSLNYRLVVEGVETNKQMQMLSNSKEFSVQGYLYSKPLSFDALEAFVRSQPKL